MPGVSIEDDRALAAALAPVIRAPDFAAWSRADREALVGELLADPGTPAGVAVARVLQVAARTYYGDPGSWPGLGYRPMPPGTSWPPEPEATPAPIGPDDLADEYDVIVIGAGAGGGVAACVLAEAGRRVLLVERGESLRREDLPRDHLRNARVFTGLERQVDPPAAGNPRFVGDAAVAPTEPAWNNNAMTVGGGTRVYGGQAWRFCPEDFRMRSTYGEPFVDWPIGYDDLAPFYERVEWELGVCGADAPRPYDGARSRGYPMPPFAPNAAEPVLARGAEALGLATGPVPLLINSVPYGGRPACIRCGTCAGLRLPRRRQEREPQHDDHARGRHRPLRPPHRRRRHAAHHPGVPRRRRGARAGRPAARGARGPRRGRRRGDRDGPAAAGQRGRNRARPGRPLPPGSRLRRRRRRLRRAPAGLRRARAVDLDHRPPPPQRRDPRRRHPRQRVRPDPDRGLREAQRRRRGPGLGPGGRRRHARDLHARAVRRRADPGGARRHLARDARARGHRRQRHARRAPAVRCPRARTTSPAPSSWASARRSGCEPAAPGRPGRCSGRSPPVRARASTRPAAAGWAPTPAPP